MSAREFWRQVGRSLVSSPAERAWRVKAAELEAELACVRRYADLLRRQAEQADRVIESADRLRATQAELIDILVARPSRVEVLREAVSAALGEYCHTAPPGDSRNLGVTHAAEAVADLIPGGGGPR